MKKTFETVLCERTDEIYNAAYELVKALMGGEAPEWDMALLGPIAEAAEKIISEDFHTCFPSHNGSEETPCYLTGACKNPCCPMKN